MAITAIALDNVSKVYRLYATPMEKALDVFGINRLLWWRKPRYELFWALRNISLTVPKGQRLGIIGSNGAGKSTLLKIISERIAPSSGKVTVNGTIQSLMLLGVGFHPDFSGRQNIRASLSLQGLSGTAIADVERDVIEFSELGEYIDQPVRTYSAGMYARLAFSTATAIKPDILIVDEILGAGDAYFAGKSLERMRTLTEDSGATVLLVSHDMGSIQAFSQRVIWMEHGEIQADGDPLEISKAYYKYQHNRELEKAYAKVKSTTIADSSNKTTRIERVRFLNSLGQEIQGIVEGESLTVEIFYQSLTRVVEPEFAMTFYTYDGRRICHANTALAGTRIDQIIGTGIIRFRFDPFPVGPGEYVVSTGIFHWLNVLSNAPPPSYDQHDRRYRLRVLKLPGTVHDLGIVRVGYTVSHEIISKSYCRPTAELST